MLDRRIADADRLVAALPGGGQNQCFVAGQRTRQREAGGHALVIYLGTAKTRVVLDVARRRLDTRNRDAGR